MSTKSKRRVARRSKLDHAHAGLGSTQAATVPTTERQAIGAIMGGLLNAITFGAVEPGPQSRNPESAR